MREETAETLRCCSDLVMRMSDPYDLSVAVIDQLQTRLDYRRSAVLLQQGSASTLSVFAHCRRGMRPDALVREIESVNGVLSQLNRGIVMSAFRGGRPVVVNDVAHSTEYVTVDSRVRSEASFPMIANGGVIGVLNVESFNEDAFQADDILMMQAVSAQIAQHIDRSRLQRFLGLSEF